jgi:TolB-like protein
LPFEDLSPDQDHKYFSDGIAEELIMQLSNIRGLRIIAKTSSFQLAGATAAQVGRRLAVSHVLTGAVRKSGARLRINVQLVETATEQQVWSGQYDRQLDDILDVQESISSAVALALRASLGLGTRVAPSGGSRNVEAYDLYLRAKSLMSRGSAQTFQTAIELCRRAVALDPDFSQAWAQIATLSRNLIFFTSVETEDLHNDIASATARAVQLEPRWWPAYLAQSALHGMNRSWSEVERSLSMATEHSTGSTMELNYNWAHFHALVGNARAAAEYQREAVLQDPLSLTMSAFYQLLLHFTGEEDIAEAEYRRSLELPGDRDMVEHVALHRAWARGGSFAAQYRRYVDQQSFPVPILAVLVERHDQPEYMVQELRQASHQPLYQHPVRQVMLGWWLAHYGAVDDATAILTRVYVNQAFPNTSWLWFSSFAAVRRRPEFVAAVEHIGLAPYWRLRQNWGDFCRPGVDGSIEFWR